MKAAHPMCTRSPSGSHRWGEIGLCLAMMVVLAGAPASAQQDSPPSTPPLPTAEESAPPPPQEAEPKPSSEKATPPASDNLAALLEEEDSTGTVGSFGYRLRRYGINSYIHGVLAADLLALEKGAHFGFELRDAHLYFGADIVNLIIPEVFLEFEPRQTPDLDLSVLRIRHAQLDLRLYGESLVLRSGIFVVPFGTYNTYSYPRFITKLPDRPTFFRQVIPTSWQEVGVELFGEREWSPGRLLSYAVYVTNGLEQLDFDEPDDPDDDGVDEGGNLNDLEPSFMEENNGAKSFGARIRGELISGLSVGLSGYTGAYTVDAARRLNVFGLDANLYRGALTLEVEAAYARQQVTGGALQKWGYYALAAYRVHPRFEPVLAIDEYRLTGKPERNRRTFWAGFNLIPFPDLAPTAIAKAIYSVTVRGGGGAADQKFTIQLAVGF